VPEVRLDLRCWLELSGCSEPGGCAAQPSLLLPNTWSLVQDTEDLGTDAWEWPESLLRGAVVPSFLPFVAVVIRERCREVESEPRPSAART